ncbi:hypothetical protein [Hyalangium rubrum]|uniref:Uncharacterized protein n=1 Tax=Hyalangium rubrum TaxID=3103134 RepID=A0ABU5H8F5_9BACT|nr:hypothetical protein [Hyalangium sp. s54d21]MDY7229757.1 hypothetical protein [Hyalangium sp. s54d21]
MGHERMMYTRSAKSRLRTLPVEVRVHLETHLANLALLVEAMPPERLPELLPRTEEGFVTTMQETRVLFTVNTAGRTMLVHRIELLTEAQRGLATDYSLAETEA